MLSHPIDNKQYMNIIYSNVELGPVVLEGGLMRFLGLIFVIAVIGFLSGFVVLNSHVRVDLDIFGQKILNVPVSLICFYAFIAGMIFILIFALADEVILRNNLRNLRKENENIKKELDALRNLPFEEEK